ncbi:MAG: histidine--tRNA ligase [Promethearchaeota archaeon]
MSRKFSKKPLRGMKDFFPSDLREVQWVEGIVRDVADLYCYEEFDTPLLEPIEIFAAKSSEELVNEQSFVVEKKKDERLILRPEITPSLARMVASKLQEFKKPLRWFSIPICYRYERPQRGRMRSFRQINFDILGEDNLHAELEMFNIIIDILTSFGATSKQFQIYYNNRRFIDAICDLVLKIPDDKMPLVYKVIDKSEKMDDKEFENYVSESFQEDFITQGILKLKNSKNLEDLLSNFKDLDDGFYETKGYKEIKKLEDLIAINNISDYCSFSSSVVRGLDYYTGTVFEVFDTGTENIRAISGGGRYDDLLSLFSDDKLSGVGFGMGVLMLSLFLKTYDLIPEYAGNKDYTDVIYLIPINESVAPYANKVAKIIREEDLPCLVDYKFKNLKTQLKKASDLGVLIVLIFGPKEMDKNQITLKNMKTEEQKTVETDNIIDEIFELIDDFGDTIPDE